MHMLLENNHFLERFFRKLTDLKYLIFLCQISGFDSSSSYVSLT